MYYPVAIFCYKRIESFQLTLRALQANYLASETDLFIYSDAGKNDSERRNIEMVRSLIKGIEGFKTVSIFEGVRNKGLANSIISGTTHVLKSHEAVIVMEDDLITTPNFLTYMNAALKRYQHEKSVFSISGYSFNLLNKVEVPGCKHDAYFLNRGWSWGWGTWKDRWEGIDWEVKDYENFKKNHKAKREFSAGGSDLNKMLAHQMKGKLDSWAIKWFYHQFKTGGLTLYPILSKVYNNGFDMLSTHTKGSGARFKPLLDTSGKEDFDFPQVDERNYFLQKRFKQKMNIYSRLKSKIVDILFFKIKLFN
jgi:hypothetical protein